MDTSIQPVESKTSVCNKEKSFKIFINVIRIALPVIFAVGAAVGGFFILQKASSLNKWRYVVGSLLIAGSCISFAVITVVFLRIFIKTKITIIPENINSTSSFKTFNKTSNSQIPLTSHHLSSVEKGSLEFSKNTADIPSEKLDEFSEAQEIFYEIKEIEKGRGSGIDDLINYALFESKLFYCLRVFSSGPMEKAFAAAKNEKRLCEVSFENFDCEESLKMLIEAAVHQCCSFREGNHFNQENANWIEFFEAVSIKISETRFFDKMENVLWEMLSGVADIYLWLYRRGLQLRLEMDREEIKLSVKEDISQIILRYRDRLKKIHLQGSEKWEIKFSGICKEVLKEFFEGIIIIEELA